MNYDAWKSTDPADLDPYRDERETEQDERERDEDDGLTYADPRDEIEERRNG